MGTERKEGRLKALIEVRELYQSTPYPAFALVLDNLIACAEAALYSVTPDRIYESTTDKSPHAEKCCAHDVPIGISCEICNGRWPMTGDEHGNAAR